MAVPVVAAVAGKAGLKVASLIRKKMGQKGKKAGAPTGKRRQRRIVFSENQWNFVQSLMRATTGRSTAPFPHRRRRRSRKPF